MTLDPNLPNGININSTNRKQDKEIMVSIFNELLLCHRHLHMCTCPHAHGQDFSASQLKDSFLSLFPSTNTFLKFPPKYISCGPNTIPFVIYTRDSSFSHPLMGIQMDSMFCNTNLKQSSVFLQRYLKILQLKQMPLNSKNSTLLSYPILRTEKGDV